MIMFYFEAVEVYKMANVGPSLLSHSICTVSLVPNPGWTNLGLLALDASV
jgi:hypothetical protein